MIEGIFPHNKTRLRIIRVLYENPGINLSELIKKSGTSPNIVLNYANKLVENGILMEKAIGGEKKPHIRQFFPNFKSELGIMVFSLIEIEKRADFLEKYPIIKPFFLQLADLLKNKTEFCLAYGSYARLSADKTSDLDLLMVGNLTKETKRRISEVFVTFPADVSIKTETLIRFKKNISKPLYQNMLREHVVLCGEQEFLKALP